MTSNKLAIRSLNPFSEDAAPAYIIHTKFVRLLSLVDNAMSIIGAAVLYGVFSISVSNPDLTPWLVITIGLSSIHTIFLLTIGTPGSITSDSWRARLHDLWRLANGFIWAIPPSFVSLYSDAIYQLTPITAVAVLVIVTSLTSISLRRFFLVNLPPTAVIVFLSFGTHSVVIDVATGVLLLVFVLGSLVATLVERAANKLIAARVAARKYLKAVEAERDKLRETTKVLNETDELFGIVANNASDIILLHDYDGRYLFANDALQRVVGYSPSEMLGKDPMDFIHPDDVALTEKNIRLPGLRGLEVKPTRCRFRRKNGSYVWLETTVRKVASNDEKINVVSVSRDITATMVLENDLRQRATTDPITGVTNRATFDQILSEQIKSVRCGEQATLVYIDIDQFKIINDTSGHLAGDEMLQATCQLLNSHLCEQDTLARMGGDEFAILLRNSDIEAAIKRCDEMRTALASARFQHGTRYYSMAASFGLVFIDEKTTTSLIALQHADVACYIAKSNGRNAVHVWHQGDRITTEHMQALDWITAMQSAIDNDRVELFAQAIHPMSDDKSAPSHYEILSLIKDESGHPISPSDYVPAAEHFGLASSLDFYIVDMVLGSLSGRQRQEQSHWVSINLSADTVCNHGSLNKLEQLFSKHDVQPQNICFEVTETATLRSVDAALALLNGLTAMGCRIALDDFGSGFSSFEHLIKLPINVVKIDGQFVQDIITNRVHQTVVESILKTAKSLGIETIAEWVEDEVTLPPK